MAERFDFLVIGGGIAGLTAALRLAEHGEVCVLFKKSQEEASTAWAQGGIAAVRDPQDTLELHIADTLATGGGIAKQEVVELVVREGARLVDELIHWGVQFDRAGDGLGFDLHREGGHSRRRILHAADRTGHAIHSALLARARAHPRIRMLVTGGAVDLLTTHKLGMEESKPSAVFGAYVLQLNGTVDVFLAEKIFVATGAVGKVYLYTSNPDIATGDGIAMCFRAGVAVSNLEFYQFHPTCLFHPRAKNFLITEALRGEGAYLRRMNGERFMERYDARAELAPRDIVARAIDFEMKSSGDEYVFLDISHRESSFIMQHFPQVYERCLSYGFDLTRQPIPVVPAAHYCCGGVVTDAWGATTVQNLYAIGECASTGLHGANRLASNSLLEGLVFGWRAAEHAVVHRGERRIDASPPGWDPGSAKDSDEEVVITQNWDEVRRVMWNYVGIVRSNKRLERALRRSRLILQEVEDYYWNFTVTSDLLELRNLSLLANLMIHSAIYRKESRGLHYTIDYPDTSPRYASDTVITPAEWAHYTSQWLHDRHPSLGSRAR